MLNLMEQKGLIARESVPGDARLKRIVLLPPGEDLCRQAQSIRSQIEARLTCSLTAEEQEQFRNLCIKILAGMDP